MRDVGWRAVCGWVTAAACAAGVALWALVALAPQQALRLPAGLRAWGHPGAWWPITVEAALATATYLLLRGRAARGPTSSTAWVGGLALGAAVLAFASYWGCTGRQSPFWTPLAWTSAIFLGDVHDPFDGTGDCPATPPAALQAARLGALVVIALVARSALFLVFADVFDRRRARRAGSLVVVIGASPSSEELVRRLHADLPRRSRLLILDAGTDARDLARGIGALHVPVDVLDPRRLRAVLVRRGTCLVRACYLLSDDTAANLRVADVLTDAIEGAHKHPSEGPGRMVVRIDDPWQAEDWRREHLGLDPRRWLHDAVSVHGAAAAAALDRVLQSGAHTVVLAGPSPFTLAFLHDLSMREREHAARLVPVADPLPVVYLVGEGARDVAAEHAELQARFGPAPRPSRVHVRPGGLEAQVDELMGDGSGTALVLGDEHGPRGLPGAARTAARHPGWTIVAWDPDSDTHADVPVMGRLFVVGARFAPHARPLDTWEWLGRAVHQRYLDLRYAGAPQPGDAARGDWDDLAPEVRESNIRQVAALMSFLRAGGWTWARSAGGTSRDPLDALSAEELEAAARNEHESWCRDLTARGWRWAATRDHRRRRQPRLVPWESLSEDDRTYTRRSTRSVLELLGTLGFRLDAAGTPGASAPDAGSGWGTWERSGTVTATRLHGRTEWTTSSGDRLVGEPGDWRVGSGTESHTVRDPIFRATHRPLGGDLWSRSGTVRARRATRTEHVATLEGVATARAGDWVVVGQEGEQWPVPDGDFRERYRRPAPGAP